VYCQLKNTAPTVFTVSSATCARTSTGPPGMCCRTRRKGLWYVEPFATTIPPFTMTSSASAGLVHASARSWT
jgi:hypothetical protein